MPVELICRADGLPMPMAEFRFAPPRRWRFDWCWPMVTDLDRGPIAGVALEIEGGIFMNGGSRHTRGKGYLNDIEKYNHATLLGWAVFRCTPQTVHIGMRYVAQALREGA